MPDAPRAECRMTDAPIGTAPARTGRRWGRYVADAAHEDRPDAKRRIDGDDHVGRELDIEDDSPQPGDLGSGAKARRYDVTGSG